MEIPINAWRAFLVVSIFVILFSWARCAEAQAAIPMVSEDGREGVWISLDVAREHETAIVERDGYAQRLSLLTTSLSIAETQIDMLRSATRLQGETVEALMRTVREVGQPDPWYEHPALWFAVGVVVTSVLLTAFTAAVTGV